MAKKLYIKTYGCQMNVYDSNRMADLLAPIGYSPTEHFDEADMIILNTCHIREHATEKVFSEVGRLEKIRKRAGKDRQILAVAGCVAQAEGEELLRRAPYIDIVLGPQSYHLLPESVAKAERARQQSEPGEEKKRGAGILETDFPAISKFDFLPDHHRPQGISAFLSVQEGCDKFCTFCVVPYTRGAEYSRPVKDLLREASKLVELGAREITLLGQNVNAYHGEGPDGKDWRLGRLMMYLAENIPNLRRLRYTTSHPRDMDEELIAAHRELPQLMPYLHLPVQSGSDRILATMNRRHDIRFYMEILEKLRKARADIAFSSDFIVGFPGESDADFAATIRLVEEISFAQAYSFKYSPRPGTPASMLEQQIPENVMEERLARLQELLNRQQRDFNRSKIGSVMDVLIEKPGRFDGQIAGKTPYLQAVHLLGSIAEIGKIIPVRMTGLGQFSLKGEYESLHKEERCA